MRWFICLLKWAAVCHIPVTLKVWISLMKLCGHMYSWKESLPLLDEAPDFSKSRLYNGICCPATTAVVSPCRYSDLHRSTPKSFCFLLVRKYIWTVMSCRLRVNVKLLNEEGTVPYLLRLFFFIIILCCYYIVINAPRYYYHLLVLFHTCTAKFIFISIKTDTFPSPKMKKGKQMGTSLSVTWWRCCPTGYIWKKKKKH